MKRAVPAIALSAAGLTWLLHAQGVIDTNAAGRSAAPPTTAPETPDPGDTAPPTSPAPRAAPPTTRVPSSASRTVDGPVVDTRYGPVQAQVVLQGARIT